MIPRMERRDPLQNVAASKILKQEEQSIYPPQPRSLRDLSKHGLGIRRQRRQRGKQGVKRMSPYLK